MDGVQCCSYNIKKTSNKQFDKRIYIKKASKLIG